MKKIVFAACSLLTAATAAYSQPTIVDITLYNSQSPGNIWITSGVNHWILGVSRNANGPLLNAANASVAGISQGDYYLFADPAVLGNFPQLHVNLSDGTSFDALFQIQGTNGTQQDWIRVSGSTELRLGWAPGAIDLVGTYGGISPDGVNDYYMTATIGVPEAPTIVMLAFGLALFSTISRKKLNSSS